jgi:hypothetical protein
MAVEVFNVPLKGGSCRGTGTRLREAQYQTPTGKCANGRVRLFHAFLNIRIRLIFALPSFSPSLYTLVVIRYKIYIHVHQHTKSTRRNGYCVKFISTNHPSATVSELGRLRLTISIGTVITSFPNAWDNKQPHGLKKKLDEEIKRSRERQPIGSIDDLVHLIIKLSVDFFGRDAPGNIKFQEAFQLSIHDLVSARLFCYPNSPISPETALVLPIVPNISGLVASSKCFEVLIDCSKCLGALKVS